MQNTPFILLQREEVLMLTPSGGIVQPKIVKQDEGNIVMEDFGKEEKKLLEDELRCLQEVNYIVKRRGVLISIH